MEKSRFVGLRLTPDEEGLVEELQGLLGLETKSSVFLYALQQLAVAYDLISGERGKVFQDDWRKTINRLAELQEQAQAHARFLGKIKNQSEGMFNDMVEMLKDVDTIVDRHGCDEGRLIQILLDIQKENNWLSKEAVDWVAKRLEIPANRVYHIATFYKAFSLVPRGRHSFAICTGTACHVRGSMRLLDRVSQSLNIKPGQTSADLKFSLDTVNCLGCCALGPVLQVDDEYYSNPSSKELEEIKEQCE